MFIAAYILYEIWIIKYFRGTQRIYTYFEEHKTKK